MRRSHSIQVRAAGRRANFIVVRRGRGTVDAVEHHITGASWPEIASYPDMLSRRMANACRHEADPLFRFGWQFHHLGVTMTAHRG